jgi:Xaa-Pro dipeptidase
MSTVPESELNARISRLRSAMQKSALDGVVILQSADLFYFTGTIQSGTLYVPAEGEPVYLVRRGLNRAREESALQHIVPIRSLREVPSLLRQHDCAMPKRVGFEWDVVPVSVFARYRDVFAGAECVDASALLRRIRMVKSNYEIDAMRRAGTQADRAYRHACESLREGMTEIELAAEVEHFLRREGHPGLIRMRSFNGVLLYAHIFSGPDSAVPAFVDTPLGGVGPHPSYGQGAGWRRIGRNEPVVVDIGSFSDGYLADQTRILCLGELPQRLSQAYDDMVQIQRLMERIVMPGVKWAEVYGQCHALAVNQGHADHFMGTAGARVGFIGHGLGIEIDELPLIAPAFKEDVFEVGMAFAFEPKAVFPGLGSVGIENTFVVHDGGIERLTISDESLAIL